MVLNGIEYGETVAVQVAPWRPLGYYRIGLRVTNEDESTTEYMSWTGRIIPAWCAASYVGVETSFTYTPEVETGMIAAGLKAWVLEDLGLEEYSPA